MKQNKLITVEEINEYLQDSFLRAEERKICLEILEATKNSDDQKLHYFYQFGDDLRRVFMNVNAYRHGELFGFKEAILGKYGWLEFPKWLNKEMLGFGNLKRLNEFSTVDIGMGPNGKWSYGLGINYGTAYQGSPLTVYGRLFQTREDVIHAGCLEAIEMLSTKLGSTDSINYKQQIIKSTLQHLEKYIAGTQQLSLF